MKSDTSVGTLLIFGISGLLASSAVAQTVLSGDTFVAWGANGNSQCNVPADLGPCIAAAAGSFHSMALTRAFTVRAWGDNTWGQSSVPIDLGACIAISGGGGHSVALRADGTIRAWGRNNYGQGSSPTSLTNVTAIAAGGDHNAALKSDGTVAAWGANVWGEGTIPASAQPSVAVNAGIWHKLAIRPDGVVVCWGRNNYGQCTIPTGLGTVVRVSGGQDSGGGHSMAIKSNGTVACWGRNNVGQSTVPSGLAGVVEIAAGGSHSLALKSTGQIVCWGDNTSGQCGVPTALPNAVSLTASDSHSLALVRANEPIQWSSSAGGNGHWYQRRWKIGDWNACRLAAETFGGHLATIGTAAEDQFIAQLVQSPHAGAWNGCFLGASQAKGSLPNEGWTWVDGTVFAYTNWYLNQPNGGELYLSLRRYDDLGGAIAWGDYSINSFDLNGYILEWSADCNGDGIVDLGQILSGELVDSNLDGIPDCCADETCLPCVGDVSLNGVIDGVDLAALLGVWGTNGQGEFDCDIDDDGYAGAADLTFILDGWGKCNP